MLQTHPVQRIHCPNRVFLDLLSGHIFFPLKIFKTENYQRRSSCSHPRRKARGSHSGRDKRRWKFSRTVAVERDTGMPLKANQFCESLECLSLIAPNRRPASIALLSWSFYTKPIWDKQLNESWNWFAKSSIPGALSYVLENFRRGLYLPDWPPLGLGGCLAERYMFRYDLDYK